MVPLLSIKPAIERLIPVTEALPTEFDQEGMSRALLVATDGHTNIYPHYYTRSGRWLEAGRHGTEPNVTHWSEYPADPALAAALPVPADEPTNWTPVQVALPPNVAPPGRNPRSEVVEVRKANGREQKAYYLPLPGGGWRDAWTHVPVEGEVVSWRLAAG